MGDVAAEPIDAGDLAKRVATADAERLSASLSPGRVHVWCVTGEDIDDPALLRQGVTDLSATEAARAARFARREDRHHFIIGKWMLRHLLAAYLSTAPRDIVFATNQHGRPELAGCNRLPLHFNLSHTDGLVACAFASGIKIGIDAEYVRPSRFDIEVARNYFSVEAWRDILDGCGISQTERFFEYWVLTEARAKARGVGLLRPADGSFVHERDDRSRIRFVSSQASDPTDWTFWLSEPAAGYRMAVAMAGEPDGPPIVRRLRPDGFCGTNCRTIASSRAFRWT